MTSDHTTADVLDDHLRLSNDGTPEGRCRYLEWRAVADNGNHIRTGADSYVLRTVATWCRKFTAASTSRALADLGYAILVLATSVFAPSVVNRRGNAPRPSPERGMSTQG